MVNSSQFTVGAIASALEKIEKTLSSCGNGFPHITSQGEWQFTSNGGWTGGFWVGLLWLAYQHTSETRFRDAAIRYMAILEPRRDEASATPDLGFLFYPSFVRGYQILGEGAWRTNALQAAERLLGCFHSKAGLLHCVYKDRVKRPGRPVGTTIVDFLMNLSLLWWAYQETQKERYYLCATTHAVRTAHLLLREDGSTFHAVDFDLESGGVVGQDTIHGLSRNSCWSRGQAWTLHGYLLAYEFTGIPLFKRLAQRAGRFFEKHLPKDGVPPWDFDEALASTSTKDSSAGAIAASGLLLASDARDDDWVSLIDMGERILKALSLDYLQDPKRGGILAHGCAYKKKGIGVDEATIWGDHYFLQGLTALTAVTKDGHIEG